MSVSTFVSFFWQKVINSCASLIWSLSASCSDVPYSSSVTIVSNRFMACSYVSSFLGMIYI